MLAFFYSLFRAIAKGSWFLYPETNVLNKIELTTNRLGTLILNALGGNFEAVQTFTLLDADLTAFEAFASIASIIAVVLVSVLTFKLVKMVFSIFFGGR